MDILAQLKGLFLQATPTVVLVVIFYFFLRSQFFAPLEKAIAERSARIEGERKSADAIRSEAEELERSYHAALRRARMGIYAELDVARRAVLDERSNLIRIARERSMAEIRSRKEAVAQEAAAARARLEAESQELASEIVRLILSGPASGPGGGPRVSGGRA